MNDNLLRFKPNQNYLCFDFETCHLNLLNSENKPWQLGYALCKGKKIVQNYDHLIKWKTLNISPEAAKICKFNRKHYEKNATNAAQILEGLEKYLYDPSYLIIGHNLLGFDVYIHNIFRKLLKKESDYSYVDRIVDTHCLAKAAKEQIKKSKNESLINWQYKLNEYRKRGLKTNQKQLLKDYNIEFDENKLHNARYDIEMTFKIFNKLIWEVEV
jgi:DNA polymerase III epsilon subunit-like protein